MSTTELTYDDFFAQVTAHVEQQDRLDLQAAVLLAGLVRQAFPAAAWVEMEESDLNKGCVALAVYAADGTQLCEDAYYDVDTALGGDGSDQLQELGSWMPEGGLWAVVASEWIVTNRGVHVNGSTWTAGGVFLDVEKALAVDVEKVMAMTYEERVALAPDIPSDHVHRSFVKEPAPATE
jgi:hypothetical protein